MSEQFATQLHTGQEIEMKAKTNSQRKSGGSGLSKKRTAPVKPASPAPGDEQQMELVAEYMSGRKSKGWGMLPQVPATDDPEP